MQTLREKNLEKGFEVLGDFIKSVPAENLNPAFNKKKTQAEAALNHIRKCLSEGENEGRSCHTSRPSQKNPF